MLAGKSDSVSNSKLTYVSIVAIGSVLLMTLMICLHQGMQLQPKVINNNNNQADAAENAMLNAPVKAGKLLKLASSTKARSLTTKSVAALYNLNRGMPTKSPYLYEADKESQAMLKELMENGDLVRLALSNKEKKNQETVLLTEHYPVLSMKGHIFTTFQGRRLNTEAVLRNILLPGGDEYPMPNVVHFFLFSKNITIPPQLKFHEYLGLVSAIWLSGINKLIFWCNVRPVGKYWNMFVRNVTVHGYQNRIMFATRPLPTSVFNRPVLVIQHQVDLMKLQSAILFGGFYFDMDSVTLRSMQPLRRHNCAIGRERNDGLAIGALMVKPSSPFVLIWYMLYQTFKDREWAVHSVNLPHTIWRKFPHLCHVENSTMMKPNWKEPELLYRKFNSKSPRYNWDKNYMVHLWSVNRTMENETSVRTLNSMYGQVARHVLYGTKNLLV